MSEPDLVVAGSDGKVATLAGGTGHSVTAALAMGTPLLEVDAAALGQRSILTRPEDLGHPGARPTAPDHDPLTAITRTAIRFEGGSPGLLEREVWRAPRSPAIGFYRRLERVFGGGAGAFGSPAIA